MLIWKGTATTHVHSVVESSRRLGIASVIIYTRTGRYGWGWFCWLLAAILIVSADHSTIHFRPVYVVQYVPVSIQVPVVDFHRTLALWIVQTCMGR